MVRRVGLCVALVTISVVGCSPAFLSLNQTTLRESQPRSVLVVQAPSPPLTALRADSVRVGLAGDAVLNAIDAAPFRATHAQDPVESIRTRVALRFAARLAVKLVYAPHQLFDERGYLDRSAAKALADLRLDVHTVQWGIQIVDRGHSGAAYSGKIELFDQRTDTLLARGTCSSRLADNQAPTYDELLKDDAAELKKELAVAAESCTEEFRLNVLGLH